MGLEALGLKVALDSKVAKKKAEQEPIEIRIARVAQTLQNRLPFDGAVAAKEIATAYNGDQWNGRPAPGPRVSSWTTMMPIQSGTRTMARRTCGTGGHRPSDGGVRPGTSNPPG